MVKITEEEFNKLQPRCGCYDHELIPWKPKYRYTGIPKYICGHQNKGKPSSKRGKPLSENHKIKIGESNKGRRIYRTTKTEFDILKPLCGCPDHEEIPWKEYYENYGIPMYLKGHSSKKYKSSEAREQYKKQQKRWYEKNPSYRRDYSLENENAIKAYRKNYYQENNEEINIKTKIYQHEHPEQHKKSVIKWNKNHPDSIQMSIEKFLNTPKGKAAVKKHNDKHRELGSLQLNKWFVVSEGHHLDSANVIYIPKKVHRSVPHNVFTGYNMEQINAYAYFFLMQQNIGKLSKLFYS